MKQFGCSSSRRPVDRVGRDGVMSTNSALGRRVLAAEREVLRASRRFQSLSCGLHGKG